MHMPKFCPHPDCPMHNPKLDYSGHFTKSGTYSTKAHGIIQRFKCLCCGRGFSEQTFRIDYYAKRVIDYKDLMNRITGSGGVRFAARMLHVSTRTIQNKTARLARQFLALMCILIPSVRLQEDLVADGFESFCRDQNFPNNIHLLAGKNSQFLYYFNYVTIRRKGRMTERQKEIREQIEKVYKADPKGIRKRFTELLDVMVMLAGDGIRDHMVLYTDEKHQYRTAWNKHKALGELQQKIHCVHEVINSKLPRTVHNPLFSVNYLDREFRKDLAEHVRETTRFGRNVSDCQNRLVIYQFWHNMIKSYRIGRPEIEQITHCEAAGYDIGKWKKEMLTVFSLRRFWSHLPESRESFRDIWFREIQTPLKERAEYLPAYAAA